jgi:hypothetical protein
MAGSLSSGKHMISIEHPKIGTVSGYVVLKEGNRKKILTFNRFGVIEEKK